MRKIIIKGKGSFTKVMDHFFPNRDQKRKRVIGDAKSDAAKAASDLKRQRSIS
jgi:hypothetical protein